MARLTGKLQVLTYTDLSSTNTPTSKVFDVSEVISDSEISQVAPLLIQIPTATTDQAINFNGITTAEYLVILSDQPISVKIDGSTTALQLTRLYLDGSSLSSLHISNSSGETANIRIMIGK